MNGNQKLGVGAVIGAVFVMILIVMGGNMVYDYTRSQLPEMNYDPGPDPTNNRAFKAIVTPSLTGQPVKDPADLTKVVSVKVDTDAVKRVGMSLGMTLLVTAAVVGVIAIITVIFLSMRNRGDGNTGNNGRRTDVSPSEAAAVLGAQ